MFPTGAISMLEREGARHLARPVAILLLCLVAILCLPSRACATLSPVSVFPIPGSRLASPRAQIAFRGLPAGQLGTIVVRGSRTGVHTGSIVGDSDGQGGSFVPFTRFTPGEVVTVSTSLSIVRAPGGTFRFTIATPAGGIPPGHWPAASRVRGDVWRFRSRPDLAPAAVRITKLSSRTARGDIFLAPQYGPVQDGPMILGPDGGVVWFKPLSGSESAADFRVQSYRGEPVLTWWQGHVTAGGGVGEDVIYNTAYQQIAVLHAANGLSADLHEFEITPQGTALITAYYPVFWDASSVHGSPRQIVLDSVVQEIDIPTGLVLFQWDSLDHVPLNDSYGKLPMRGSGHPYGYFHVNSVELDRDGDLVVSARITRAAYKISHQTGAVIWRLGGKHSSFKLGPGASFAFQHDVRVRSNNDLFVTMFDNGAGPPTVHTQSRGLKLMLDLKHMTARRVAEHDHAPPLLSNFEGNFQQLPNRDDFMGWGQQPYFTEYDPRGRLIFDGRFVDANSNYRAYRLPWSGAPVTLPAVTAAKHGRMTVVYASWNGATAVASWRVLGGGSLAALRTAATAPKRGFETSITIAAQRYMAVQALDGSGNVLATSPVAAPR